MKALSRLITLAALALALLATPGLAQDAKTLERKRDKKLAAKWFTQNPWTNDYDAARKRAAESGKVIFAYFTRSYAY